MSEETNFLSQKAFRYVHFTTVMGSNLETQDAEGILEGAKKTVLSSILNSGVHPAGSSYIASSSSIPKDTINIGYCAQVAYY